MAGVRKLAEMAKHGRYGDTEMVHMNPNEIAVLEQMLGRKLTVNPETGQREAFSWGSLLGMIGAIGASVLFPAAAPFLMPIAGGLGVASAASAVMGKKDDPKQSEAGAYLKDKAKQDIANNAGVPIIAANLNQNTGGYDPLGREKNYFSYGQQQPVTPTPMNGGIQSLMSSTGYAAGGQLEPEEIRKQQIIEAAQRAIHGQSQDPHGDLSAFIAAYGPDALQSLAGGGKVQGPGGGMDDMVSAQMGDQKVLLSPDEFVVPADVVSGLGDGSSEAGARKLHAMMSRVRSQRTGTTKQPRKVNDMKVMPR